MDKDEAKIRALAGILKSEDLGEIEFEKDGVRVRVVARAQAPLQAQSSAVPLPSGGVLPPAPMVEGGSAPPAPAGAVLSPMVGTAYLQGEPGTPPFVKKGDRIAAGDTLLIVEAMKVMNQIKAERGGVVTDVLVADGQPVEFGQPLIVLT